MCLVVPSVKRRVKKLGHSTAGLNFTLLFTMSLGGFLTFQHCVKRVRISSYYGPYFLAFGLNTERYEVKIVRIQSYSGPYSLRMRKMRTRINPNTDTFPAVQCSFRAYRVDNRI